MDTKQQGLIGADEDEEGEADFTVPEEGTPVDLDPEEDDDAPADSHALEVEEAEAADDAGDAGEDWQATKDVTPDMSADDPAGGEEAEG